MANEDADFVVRIKDITDPTLPTAAIVVRPNVNSSGYVNVGGLSDPSGTDIMFKLNGAMRKIYNFDTNPICVYDKGAGQTDCTAGALPSFPNGWSIGIKNDNKVVLHVPPLGSGANYKYKLFLNLDLNPAQKVVIDPRIGCCQIDQSKIEIFLAKAGLGFDAGVAILLAIAAAASFFTARKIYLNKAFKPKSG